MTEVVWVLWIWFFPFNYTMDSRFIAVPGTSYPTKEICLAEKAELEPKLADMWPDEKADVERIEVHCIPRHK